MAAYINRTVALGDSMISRHKPPADEKISSPLQIFGQAKKQINSIFIDIQNYVADASNQMTGNYYKHFNLLRDLSCQMSALHMHT